MRCENCGHCVTEGYEYPEAYCELGIGDDDPLFDGLGCSYTKAQRKIICKRQKKYDVPLWWDESEQEEKP